MCSPQQKKSVSCNSLHLLKIGLWMKINSELLNILERRIVSMQLQYCVPDLLVKNNGDLIKKKKKKNNGDNENGYDVSFVLSVQNLMFPANQHQKYFLLEDLQMVILCQLQGMKTLVQKVLIHLQKQCQKMLGIVITTSMEPLTFISRYGRFFVPSDHYFI